MNGHQSTSVIQGFLLVRFERNAVATFLVNTATYDSKGATSDLKNVDKIVFNGENWVLAFSFGGFEVVGFRSF